MRYKNTNSRQGYTLVEILIGSALVIIILGSLFAMLRIGFKSSEKGTDKLVAAQKIRKPLLQIKKDVKQCASTIKIDHSEDDKETTLEIKQLDLDPDGIPCYETGSQKPKEKTITYRFSKTSGNLVRNGKKVASGLENINFHTFEFLHGDTRLPALSIELSVKAGEKTVNFRTVAVSRYLIYWARDPNWVDNVTRSLITFQLTSSAED